jgi:Xaa-Pro aminopeptidase
MPRLVSRALVALAVVTGLSRPIAAQAPASSPITAEQRAATAARRARLAERLDRGLAIIQAADRSQPNLYEFMVPDTEHHDFVYLTGLDQPAAGDAVLVLNPRGSSYREVLYTPGDPARVKQATGITHVFPREQFLVDLSSALTDYRNLRITQLRFKPVASDLSLGLGDTTKVIWFNYPRFTNLHEPPQPRFALLDRLRAASPELVFRDASEHLDRLRMVQDPWGLAQIRQAVALTRLGLEEAMRVARPGMTTREVGELIDFTYRFNGAQLGFPTGVSAGRAWSEAFATAREEMQARAGSAPLREGDLIHVDTGAEWQRVSADVQRVFPVGARFTASQRAFYTTILNVQKAVIARIRPGVTWQELQDLAVSMLRDAGGLDRSYTYGIGHFIGLEVHEHGDYRQPLEAGMVVSIEQGAIQDGLRVAFEDDVLVTPTGHEWLTKSIPIELDDVEAMRRQPPALTAPERLRLPAAPAMPRAPGR